MKDLIPPDEQRKKDSRTETMLSWALVLGFVVGTLLLLLWKDGYL